MEPVRLFSFSLPSTLGLIGGMGLFICANSLFQPIGYIQSTYTVDSGGRVWGTKQHFIGLQLGVLYDFDCHTGYSGPVQVPAPVLSRQTTHDWGVVRLKNEPRDTTFGFSMIHYPGVSMANQFYAADQLSFPLWLLFAACFSPVLYRARRARRRRSLLRRNICPVCRYNLTANTSGIRPECGTPVD